MKMYPLPGASGAITTTVWTQPADPFEDRRPEERRLCDCGLIQVGYWHSWAAQHAAQCPAASLFAATRDPAPSSMTGEK